jgi:small nuclear ribonucleoprotein (snRNP)-like protein
MASSTASTTNSPSPSTSTAEATLYLSTFLNRTLHLHTTDGRMFAGQMKCTDPQRNIILSMTHEYRQPSTQDIQLAAQRHERAGKSGNVKVDLKKRFVGLVVVPGEYITRIEVEE